MFIISYLLTFLEILEYNTVYLDFLENFFIDDTNWSLFIKELTEALEFGHLRQGCLRNLCQNYEYNIFVYMPSLYPLFLHLYSTFNVNYSEEWQEASTSK